ncbi:MAG: DUF2085 domain-containing protein [Anaeroplasmataceae bacterium]
MNKFSKFLKIFYGCHSMPSRSFKYKDKYFPICSRCTGLFIGNILALIGVWFSTFTYPILILFCLPMIIDGSAQKLKFYESDNITRFITGLLAGFFGMILIIKLNIDFTMFAFNLGKSLR